MSVLVANAYSARNAGDGLLVDLSAELLVEAGHRVSELRLVAVDPASYKVPFPVVAAPAAYCIGRGRRFTEVPRAVARGSVKRLEESFSDASLIAPVGGGYLRFGRPVEAAKAAVAHIPQLRMAVRAQAPCVLLPQSIGPLGRSRGRVLQLLRQCDTIYVRDDRSADELAALDNVTRVPDLAVMAVAQRTDIAPRTSSGKVGVVLRALDRRPGYEARVRLMLEMLGSKVVPLLQSEAGAGNRDLPLYQRLGARPAMWLDQAVEEGLVDAVISVRLHGALEAVLNGIPAVHIAYERKGHSAFADLGVGDFVHRAGSFDPCLVADQAAFLAESPLGYWTRIAETQQPLLDHRKAIVARLSELAP